MRNFTIEIEMNNIETEILKNANKGINCTFELAIIPSFMKSNFQP